MSYDQVTVAVAACVCLPRGAFIFGLGYSLRLIKSFIDTAAFTNLLGSCSRPRCKFTPDPVVYTTAQSKVTSFKHDVASSTGFFSSFYFLLFFLHLLVAVLLFKTCTATPANQSLQYI